MTTTQLETLLTGKTAAEAMRVLQIATNPLLMVSEGLDFTNVQTQTIPGAVRFEVFDSHKDSVDPNKFAVGYVTFVNGPMNPMYVLTDADFKRLEGQHPKAAIDGLRNQKLICAKR